jgi:hypothetical protein
MKRAPNWTPEEFETLVKSAGDADDEVVCRLDGGRSIDAVNLVRGALHEYHRKGDSPLLSRMMREYLAARRGTLKCPQCSVVI